MNERNPISGKRFGMFTVIRPLGNGTYLCLCDCGHEFVCMRTNIVSGRQKSCGCLRRTSSSGRVIIHGQSKTKLYGVWRSMHSRCENRSQKSYLNYGGRGITVCDEWKYFDAFFEWAMHSGYSIGLQIDRIDNDLGYSPENCRWVTQKENANNKRNTTYIFYNGSLKPLSEVAREECINPKTLRSRIFQYGFSIEEALSLPAKKGNNQILRKKA